MISDITVDDTIANAEVVTNEQTKEQKRQARLVALQELTVARIANCLYGELQRNNAHPSFVIKREFAGISLPNDDELSELAVLEDGIYTALKNLTRTRGLFHYVASGLTIIHDDAHLTTSVKFTKELKTEDDEDA